MIIFIPNYISVNYRSSTFGVNSELNNIIISFFSPLAFQLITPDLIIYLLSYYFNNYTPFINYYFFSKFLTQIII